MTLPKGPAGVEECETQDCTGCQWCTPEVRPVREGAFFSALFDLPWPAILHVRAIYGRTMREHADAAHPEAIEDIALKCTEPLEPAEREAWLFGYRFYDTPPPGGDGVGDAGRSGS